MAYQVDANGNPVPMSPPYPNQQNAAPAVAGSLADQLASLQAQLNALIQNAGAQPVNPGVVNQNAVVEPTAGTADVNPFVGAA